MQYRWLGVPIGSTMFTVMHTFCVHGLLYVCALRVKRPLTAEGRVQAMYAGVARFYDSLVDKSWAGWRRPLPKLVLHVEMRYGERCLNMSHNGGKYEALLEKLRRAVASAEVCLWCEYVGAVVGVCAMSQC